MDKNSMGNLGYKGKNLGNKGKKNKGNKRMKKRLGFDQYEDRRRKRASEERHFPPSEYLKTGTGIFANFIMWVTDHSTPVLAIQQSANFNKEYHSYHTSTLDATKKVIQLKFNGNTVSEGFGPTTKRRKALAATIAIREIREKCYTIYASGAYQSRAKVVNPDDLGCKTENFGEDVTKYMTEWQNVGFPLTQIFSKEFTARQRSVIAGVARHLGLQCRKYGGKRPVDSVRVGLQPDMWKWAENLAKLGGHFKSFHLLNPGDPLPDNLRLLREMNAATNETENDLPGCENEGSEEDGAEEEDMEGGNSDGEPQEGRVGGSGDSASQSDLMVNEAKEVQKITGNEKESKGGNRSNAGGAGKFKGSVSGGRTETFRGRGRQGYIRGNRGSRSEFRGRTPYERGRVDNFSMGYYPGGNQPYQGAGNHFRGGFGGQPWGHQGGFNEYGGYNQMQGYGNYGYQGRRY